MMEEGLESSTLEDNLDTGLSFGDDSQKIEKMNQSFLLLKKKLFRSHDLIQQYSNKMKECERLKSELETCQRDTERFKQQHLTATAKVLRLSMEKTKLEESTKKLEKLVTEQETQLAGDQRLVQQLSCKVEDIEDRNSERVMQIELEKSGLQVKVKELEQEIKRINKVYGNEVKKLEKKLDGASKKGNKKDVKASQVKSRRIAGLGVIDDDDRVPEAEKFLEILEHVPESLPADVPEVPQMNLPIDDNKLPQKSVKDIGINVNFSTTPAKPMMMDKNIMTDEFYNITDNPYPIFCAKCEKLLDEIPEDAISKAMRLPPRITELPPSPARVRPVDIRQSSEKRDANNPVVLDSLQRRVKLLEKRIKRQQRVETPQQSCCSHSHSMNHCGLNNSFNPPNQFDMMTEFFSRMMQLPGFQGSKSQGECIKSQKNLFSAKMKKKKRKMKMKRSKDLSTDSWHVESDEDGVDNDNSGDNGELFSRPRTQFNRNSFSHDDPDAEDDFFTSMSSNRIGERRRETIERIIDEPRVSTSQERLSMTPEPEVDLFNDENSRVSSTQKRKYLESSTSPTEEPLPRRRKRTEEPKPVNSRLNLLKNLRRLTKNNSAVKKIASISNKDQRLADNINSPGDVSFKKRIAHIPKQSELISLPKTSEENSSKLPEENSTPIDTRGKRITRSLQKSTGDQIKKNIESIKSTEEEITDKDSNRPDSSDSEIQQLPSTESPAVEKNLEITDEEPEMVMIDEVENLAIDEAPASPTEETPHLSSEIIHHPSIYETAAVSDCSDTEQTPQPLNTSNCFRALRNRKIHMSPASSKSISQIEKQPIESTESLPALRPSSPPFEVPPGPMVIQKMSKIQEIEKIEKIDEMEKIEVLLDNYLATTKKPRGRKPKIHEVAKLLHNNAEILIKQQLKRLIESPDWEETLHTSVSMALLNTKSPRTVAKAVVDILIDRSKINEPLDRTYTPPAPPMTKSLQKIVTLLKDLDGKMPNLINFVFQAIEYTLFRLNSSPDWEAIEELSKLFTVLAKIKKDRERVRIMCCDAVYGLQRKSLIVLHAVLTCWPEVLPMYDADKNQYLPICIVHVIRMHSSDQHGKGEQVKRLIKGFFNYPQNEPSEIFGNKLMNVLANNYNKCVETAILLLSKKEGTEWAYKHVIQGGLMPIIVEGKSLSIYHPLKLLGFLMRPFPVADGDGSVEKIVEQLRALAETSAGPPELQEGAISALLSLSRHRFDDIACTVLNWRPTREFPMFMLEQLNAFFAARNTQWSHIKFKTRKYASNL